MTAPEDQNGLREALARDIREWDNRTPGRRGCTLVEYLLRPAGPLASLIAERDALSYRRRWNVEERDGDVVAICHGHHDRSDDCDWIEYVPLASLRAAEAEITRLKDLARLIHTAEATTLLAGTRVTISCETDTQAREIYDALESLLDATSS